MEDSDRRNRAEPGRSGPHRETRESGSQTDSRIQGHGPRLSKVNLFTLLSLWMELFPQEQPEDSEDGQIHGTGLVVVQGGKVLGLHCSGAELHAGQSAIIQHGASLADCQLYYSRRPCATCLKMIINAGVSQISFWPGDPEISMLTSTSPAHTNASGAPLTMTEEAVLDAVAIEKLKSNSRPHICVLLQPLAPGLVQFVEETSRESDFMERMTEDDPGLNKEELFNRQRQRHFRDFSRQFLVGTSQQHKEILVQMGLENFCAEPYFSNLRNNMTELVEVLAGMAAGVPQHHYGFYSENFATTVPPHAGYVSQEVARHCIIQARLLAYRTGWLSWNRLPGFGRLRYNAYPAGSSMRSTLKWTISREDRQRRKYRYIVHAEQNALTFRTRDIKPDESTMLFVTKCPCDECVPLIRGAGITHIYTSDQDRDKDKGDISYLRFSTLKDISKFVAFESVFVIFTPGSYHFPRKHSTLKKERKCKVPPLKTVRPCVKGAQLRPLRSLAAQYAEMHWREPLAKESFPFLRSFSSCKWTYWETQQAD